MTISTLDPTKPTDLEPAGQGAAEIRATRLAVYTAFPGVDGEIQNEAGGQPTAAEFTALFTRLQALEGTSGVGVTPVGMISMWSGLISAIPAGWVLCNGLNSTPNLTDRFVVGAGDLFTEGETSAGVYNPDKTLDTATGGAGTGSGTVSFPDHTIAVDNLPEHEHFVAYGNTGTPNAGDAVASLGINAIDGGGDGEYHLKKTAGSYAAETPNVGVTSRYGTATVSPLTHPDQDIDVTGIEHDHVYGVPYLALAYIMYTG